MRCLRGTVPTMVLVDENYRDNCQLREQDIVDAERYLSMRDRAPATGRGVPFFSGREPEIGAFREMANGLSRGLAANASIVVEGPPGVGKSALMCQFMEEMRALPPTGGRRWLPVPLSAGSAWRACVAAMADSRSWPGSLSRPCWNVAGGCSTASFSTSWRNTADEFSRRPAPTPRSSSGMPSTAASSRPTNTPIPCPSPRSPDICCAGRRVWIE